MFVPPNPPPGTAGVRINGGATYATSRASIADIIWPAGTRYVDLANRADFSDVVRNPISTQLAWSLAAGADGSRTVHFRFLDAAGGLISAGTASIVLDAAPPAIGGIALQRGTGDVVTVTPALTDAISGVASWQATVNPAAPGPALPASRASTTIAAPVGESVYVRAVDQAGNVSSWVSVAAPAAPAPAGQAQQPSVVVTGTAVRSSGDAVVGTRCLSTGGECRVRLTMVVNGARVSSTDSVLADGAVGSFIARLPAGLQRQLARRGTMRAVITAQVTSGGVTTTEQKTVTLVAPNARRVIQVRSARMKGSRDSLTVAARCAGTPAQRCRATVALQLVAAGPGRPGQNQVTVVGATRMEGASGTRLGARVRLSSAGRRLLRKHGSLRVRPVITITGRHFRGPVVTIGGMTAPQWIRAVLAELDRNGDARGDLNALLDRVEAGEVSPQAGAGTIERDIIPRREETLRRLRDLPPPPPGLMRVRDDAIAAFTASIAANTATAGHLRQGGKPTNDPNSPLHVKASAIKERLMADLAAAARPYRISVPPARALWP
jgi:hypothetical protein